MIEYPKMVYPDGIDKPWIIVNSKEEENELTDKKTEVKPRSKKKSPMFTME